MITRRNRFSRFDKSFHGLQIVALNRLDERRLNNSLILFGLFCSNNIYFQNIQTAYCEKNDYDAHGIEIESRRSSNSYARRRAYRC